MKCITNSKEIEEAKIQVSNAIDNATKISMARTLERSQNVEPKQTPNDCKYYNLKCRGDCWHPTETIRSGKFTMPRPCPYKVKEELWKCPYYESSENSKESQEEFEDMFKACGKLSFSTFDDLKRKGILKNINGKWYINKNTKEYKNIIEYNNSHENKK